MVWVAVSYYGTVELEFQTAKMTATTYKEMLERNFPKFCDISGLINWNFQQDNGYINTARRVKNTYLPDLNLMENVWGGLFRKVYESSHQFEDGEKIMVLFEAPFGIFLSNFFSQHHKQTVISMNY